MRRLRFGGWALIVVAMMVICAGRARTQGKFGVGVIIGEPTGFAWKYKVSGANAFDGAIGLTPGDRFRFHFDYLWEKRSFQEEHLLLHYGAGIAFGTGGSQYLALNRGDTYVVVDRTLGFALRGVVGLTYEFPRSLFDAFVELAPLLLVTPAGGLGFDAAVGVRVYP
jgi:hypothetical protein